VPSTLKDPVTCTVFVVDWIEPVAANIPASIPVKLLPSPLYDPVKDPVKCDAPTADAFVIVPLVDKDETIASEPDIMTFFQFGIYSSLNRGWILFRAHFPSSAKR
jgi:hypothetical protein